MSTGLLLLRDIVKPTVILTWNEIPQKVVPNFFVRNSLAMEFAYSNFFKSSLVCYNEKNVSDAKPTRTLLENVNIIFSSGTLIWK
ncbi:11889_t:CDS:2 [Funneliformis mosseae]|uniref:11889_t:CDS:1 n=1 Tax=Funneliformis mosseae TaxID=27381 RepID=A0A9N8W189_FUNMO|nr:11889_t:CDS:2 [Funneliformis mosseae]